MASLLRSLFSGPGPGPGPDNPIFSGPGRVRVLQNQSRPNSNRTLRTRKLCKRTRGGLKDMILGNRSSP